VVVHPRWNDQSRQAALAMMRHYLGDALRYELSVVEEIPLAPNGKFQMIVPMLPDTAAAA
jgi:hypothetical protein